MIQQKIGDRENQDGYYDIEYPVDTHVQSPDFRVNDCTCSVKTDGSKYCNDQSNHEMHFHVSSMIGNAFNQRIPPVWH